MPDIKIEAISEIFGYPDICLVNSGLFTIEEKRIFSFNSAKTEYNSKTASILLGVDDKPIAIEISESKINVFYDFRSEWAKDETQVKFYSFHLRKIPASGNDEIYSLSQHEGVIKFTDLIELTEAFLDKRMKHIRHGLITERRCGLLACELYHRDVL